MTKLLLLIAITTGLLMSCADFPESYENVIEDQKIRPFAVVLDPPEASPGDTVDVTLHLYDAGKEYSVEWALQLDYSVDNYNYLSSAGKSLNLDSMAIPVPGSNADSRLRFRFVVPRGEYNPFFHSPLVPEIQIPEKELSGSLKQAILDSDIKVTDEGVTSRSLVEYFENQTAIPKEFTPLVDGMIALVRLNAKVKSDGLELDVEKKLSVRYSSRLEPGGISNTNRNPALDSIGIITVKKADITDPEKIAGLKADTQYFSINAFNINSGSSAPVDTFIIQEDWSYFLIADSAGAAQRYVSPGRKEHNEQLFYQWFYTNLDETGAEWDELIEIGAEESETSLPVVSLKVPKDKSMKNFIIRATVGDWRPEWGMLSATGLGYLEVRGYFKYE